MVEKMRWGEIRRRQKVERDRRSPSSFQPLFDPEFRFNPDAHEEWRYRDERLMLNGEDVEELLKTHQDDIGVMADISTGLEAYRQFVESRFGGEQTAFSALVHGVQTKILNRFGKMYDTLSLGIRCDISDDRLWINDVDITSLINLYRLRPTTKARAYLQGFREKLALILERRKANSGRNGILHKVESVFDELEQILDQTPTVDTPRLAAGTFSE